MCSRHLILFFPSLLIACCEFRERKYQQVKENVRHLENNDSFYYEFQDAFDCSPCICYNLDDYFVAADCNNRNLRRLPRGLPATVRSLSISSSHLQEFNPGSVLHYSLLNTFVAQFNTLLTKVVHIPATNMSSQLTRLDLSHNSIQTVQNGSLRYHGKLEEISLAVNKLFNISADMFEGIQNLKSLNLSRNFISHIDYYTFETLESLQSLDLSKNRLGYYYKCIPPYSFQKLENLQKLYLQGNVHSDLLYISQPLSKLNNLTHIYLDTNMYSKFGRQMKSLKKLTTLLFGGHRGNCILRNITGDFLDNTPHLATFILSGCGLFYIDPSVYTNVINLETLEISRNSETYDLYDAFDHLQGLVHSSLKILRLISLTHTRYLCRTLRKDQGKYLQHIPLEELNLSQNKIVLIGRDFAELLPKTIRRLILIDNRLSVQEFTLPSLHFLSELIELHLDRQDYSYRKDTSSLENHVQKKKKESNMPPKLKIIKGSNFTSFESAMLHWQWRFNNSFRDITFKNNFLVSWGEGTLPPKIEKADLSNNFARTLTVSFFKPNNSLISLNINNNILGECFADDPDGHIFSRSSKLKFLDISMNLITTLHRPFFIGLKNLEILLVTNNKLQILNVSLSHMSSLHFINFSRNSITWIDQTTRDDLDILASAHNVYLDLSFNPLPCTCEGLPVLQWMAYTNVNLVNQIYLRCQSEGGRLLNIGNLQVKLTAIQRACASRAIILVISVSFSVFVVLFVVLALVYRFRWKIRYLRNIALAKFVGFKPKNIFGDNFQYDAYFIYGEELVQFVFKDCVQELEVKRGHRLLLADRDIMPGSIMTSAILSAIQNSYKTIPVVTPDFYDDVYSEYAVKMAIMEEIYGQRQFLHLCLYQHTDPEEISKDLLSIMHRNHYTEYPPEQDRTEDLVEHFWDQLSGCIQQKI